MIVADQTVAMLSDRDTKTAEQIIINDDKLLVENNAHVTCLSMLHIYLGSI